MRCNFLKVLNFTEKLCHQTPFQLHKWVNQVQRHQIRHGHALYEERNK